MDTISKGPQRRATIELWRIAVLVVGALCFALLAVGRTPSRDTHETILTSLRAIDVNHASLQRDILRARAGLLKEYDPIETSIANLHAAVKRLRAAFPESGVENAAALNTELDVLSASIDRDDQLVERFKAGNLLLQNAMAIATQTLSDLHASDDPSIKNALSKSADLGNLMMRFAAEPTEGFARAIEDNLNSVLRSPAVSSPDIQTYATNARTILQTLPTVDDTIEAIQASRTSDEAQILQIRYLDAFGVISIRSAWTRILLGSISVLLCVYVAILVYRLRGQTHRLTQQLDLENLTADIKRRFSEEHEAVVDAVSSSLNIVSEFFDAGEYAFYVVDGKSNTVRQRLGNASFGGRDSFRDKLPEQITATAMKETLHWDRFYYNNLLQSEMQSFPEGAMSAGSVVAASIDTDQIAILFLEHREVRRKPSGDEIRLLGHAVITLAQCIRARTERKERQQLEARLEHAQRLEAVGTLAGGIAHEFNNTLGAIMGYGEMALQINRGSTRTRQYLKEIVSSGHRAKHIIDQILTFSRKRDRVNRPFDVGEAVEDIVPLIRLSMPGNVTLTTSIERSMQAILGNPIDLQQALMNLCTNAVQAAVGRCDVSVKASQVEIGTSLSLSHGELAVGRYVCLSVIDSAGGIAPSILPHIFEPFFTTRSKSGGTGLGLAAVHGHVTGMGGAIHVESEVGSGSTFRIYLPCSSQAPVPLASFFDEKTVPLGDGELVILGQRDNNVRLMYEEKIAALGYEPLGLPSLAGIKQWLESHDRLPDVILLDLDLWQSVPDIRGVIASFAPIPVLFLTDPERDSLDQRAFAEIRILRKPLSSNSLANGLFQSISNRSKQDLSAE